MIIVFSFAYDPEKQEGTFAGNCEPMAALQILQQLIIANAIEKAKKEKPAEKPEKEEKDG